VGVTPREHHESLVVITANGCSVAERSWRWSRRAVDRSHRENELASLAAELDRYWLEQLRRAKEICDLLERQFSAVSRPHLRLVSSVPAGADPTHGEGQPPQ